MPPDPLLTQLIQRCQIFKEKTGLTSRELGKLTGINEQHLCDFLAGRKGLSTKSTMRLLQVVNSSKAQLEAKLVVKAVNIAHFQEGGRKLAEQVRFAAPPAKQFEWVPGLSGQDPNGSTDITSTITARDNPNADDYLAQTIAMLRDQQQILRQADAHIEAYIVTAQKAHPNPNGSTGPARQISRPKTAGPIPPDFI